MHAGTLQSWHPYIHKTCAMFAEKGTARCFLSRNGSFSECCASCAAIQVLAGGQSKRLLQDKLLYMFCTLALGTVCSLRSGERTAHLWQLYPVCFDTSYAVSFNNISVMPTPSHTKHHTHIHIPLFLWYMQLTWNAPIMSHRWLFSCQFWRKNY